MPAGRPRTSPDPHAHRARLLGDAELAADAPEFLAAPGGWQAETKAAYLAYQRSEAAKALRAEDVYAVKRLFGYLDLIAQHWITLETGECVVKLELQSIRTLEEMAQKLAASLGVGPRARQSLGIKTENRPGSRLDAFRRNDS